LGIPIALVAPFLSALYRALYSAGNSPTPYLHIPRLADLTSCSTIKDILRKTRKSNLAVASTRRYSSFDNGPYSAPACWYVVAHPALSIFRATGSPLNSVPGNKRGGFCGKHTLIQYEYTYQNSRVWLNVQYDHIGPFEAADNRVVFLLSQLSTTRVLLRQMVASHVQNAHSKITLNRPLIQIYHKP
jgi:hypothetical protein